MPGSCDSDQSSSSSLISSLRRFRFQNKTEPAKPAETPAPKPSSTPTPVSNFTGRNPRNGPIATLQRSNSAYNPLGYRKYENATDSQTLLESISAKIQILFKNNAAHQILDLKLTIPENDQFKEIILQHTGLSVKWSSCVTETSSLNPSEKLYKIKKTYLRELAKKICNALNNKLATNNRGHITPENTPVRTYSRTKSSAQSSASQSSLNNSAHSPDISTPGSMDDYEEFCEKEQALRKMLDAFPGADIMEAQDILVKCQWDLNKAIQEANNLPLRTTRKRGPAGSFMTQSQISGNLPNQAVMPNSEQMQTSTNQIPEEIVLDSSDEEDTNSSAPVNDRPTTGQPPAKRPRRPISTSSSEDEAVGRGKDSSVTMPYQRPQLQPVPVTQVQQNSSLVQQKPSAVSQPRPSSVAQPRPNPLVQPSPNPLVQPSPSPVVQPTVVPPVQPMVSSVAKATSVSSLQRTETRSPVNENNSPVEKLINVPQGLSLKPVPISTTPKPVSTSANNDQPSSAAMPNLPKWLVVTQVGTDNSAKTVADNETCGSPVNGNHVTSIPSNSNKSAQLVRIKSSNSITAIPISSPNPSGIPVNSQISCTPVGKNVSITAVSKSVSITPVTQTVSVSSVPKSTPKMLSITPVGGDNEELSQEKSTYSSSTEEEPDAETSQKSKKGRIKNLNSLQESDDKMEQSPKSPDVLIRETNPPKKKGKGKGKGKNSKGSGGKRKRFDSDDDNDDDYGNEDIYDSEDSDCGENLTPAHSAVLRFFQDATPEELATVPGCSKKKIDIVLNLRPFSKWADLVEKLKNDKSLSTDLLNGAKKVLDMRNAITKLMAKCQRISLDMEDLVENLKENKETCSGYVSTQPDLLNERMHLTGYQMLGLNWLLLMHNQEVNGILADEMGLGKTVQAISFLAYLKQMDEIGPHLIVVPSSTLDNWKKELETWWPTVSLICYHGQQEARRELRMQILNDEVDEFDVMITTYNMVTSSAEDRTFFKRLEFNYVVFDEAHMLKNMSSQRYANLMRIKAPRRLLLTGTPLQNNLVELMSLLIFAMPHMFSGKTEQIKQMFTCVSKTDGSNKNTYEKDRIEHAKRIMKPFVLRRLKKDVLKELPCKQEETRSCPMAEDQAEKYNDLVKKFSAEVQESKEEKDANVSSSGAGMMMQLRRGANHPLLLRRIYDDEKLLEMSKKMLEEPTHTNSNPNLIFEDMAIMSDFELHKLCKQFKSIESYSLPDSTILNSGKFKVLDELLPELLKEDHRILLFSQFTMVLDIVQEYMNIKEYKFLRLDGQVPVHDRQQLIDEFNNDPEILVFLLSTRAGGLGINLTAADTVILHDIDFNPYNDKQAEDRCHRVGQVRDVRVIRMISENTIEEGILQRATEKLKLERDIHEDETEENDTASVAMLLRDALGLKPNAAKS